MFAFDHPRAEDFGAVATCTAVGCLAMGFVLIAAAGGNIGNIGSCSPGSCSGCDNTCGTMTPSTSSDPMDSSATIATAGAGVGAAVGLLIGGAYVLSRGGPNNVDALTLALTTGSGLVLGGTVGGAIGGGIAGHHAN
jgi:hypothetical protein